MKAQEARELTDKSIKAEISSGRSIEWILEGIRQRAESGFYHAHLEYKNPIEIAKLKNLGYRVEVNTDLGVYIVYW